MAFPGQEPATPEEVQQFLMENPVKEEGVRMFMQMHPMLQRIVINSGSLAGARDPTGAFIGRMKKVNERHGRRVFLQAQRVSTSNMDMIPGNQFAAAGQGYGPAAPGMQDHRANPYGAPGMAGMDGMAGMAGMDGMAGMPGMAHNMPVPQAQACGIQPATREEVQQFLMENPVKEEGVLMFMQLDPIVQRMVINRGSLETARDPTGAFISRMKSIQKTAQAMPTFLAPQLQSMKRGTLKAFYHDKGFGFLTPIDMSEDVFFHAQAVTNGDTMDMFPGAKLWFEEGLNERNGKMHAIKIAFDKPDLHGGMAGADGAAGMMDNMSTVPGQQDQMAEQGGSVIQPATPEEVQQFLIENPVKEEAVQMFMQMSPKMQRMVINRGSLEGARDPTGAFIGRMKTIKKTVSSMPTMLPQNAQSMTPGTLSSFDHDKGFGFITPSNMSEDVFFHVHAVANGSNADMITGAKLRFEVGMNERNGRTQAVRVVLDVPGVMGGMNDTSSEWPPKDMVGMMSAMSSMMQWMMEAKGKGKGKGKGW